MDLIATVYKSTGSWYTVKADNGQVWQCRTAGRMKMDQDITSTNPLAVGDQVEVDIEDEEKHLGIIGEVSPRRNYVVRSSPHRRMQKHIVAANLDLAVLVATVLEPKTSQGFIDRFLVTTEAYHVPAILVFNKMDAWTPKAALTYQRLASMYEKVGYQVVPLSAKTGSGIDVLERLTQGKTSLLSGHSGVGKSTLLNGLIPGLKLKTQEVSGWSGKGMHTTTFAEMYDLPYGGRVIDTPGIRELGIVDMNKTELSHYFIEMQPLIPQCQFNNCLHLDEPGCAVKEAVEAGQIYPERYISYLTILDSLEEPAW